MGGVHNYPKINTTPGRTLGKWHLATGASQEKTPRARGALRGRGRGRALACPGTPTHVPVCLKSRVRSIFLHHLYLKEAWRLLQLCIAALAGRCWALGGLHPRTYSGALTRTRRRRSFCAARQHDLEKVRFPRKIKLQTPECPSPRVPLGDHAGGGGCGGGAARLGRRGRGSRLMRPHPLRP